MGCRGLGGYYFIAIDRPVPRSSVKLAVSPQQVRQLQQENDAAEFRFIEYLPTAFLHIAYIKIVDFSLIHLAQAHTLIE